MVLSKSGGGVLTISGAQANDPGSGVNVLAGRVNLKSNAGAPAMAGTAAIANLVLQVTKAETIPSMVVLGANQELAGLEVASTASTDTQGLDLNSPTDPGAFRAVRVYATDLAAAKNSIFAAIVNANALGATDPHDGIFDSGLSAHPGARIGMAIVNDAHGDANVLIRPTRVGDLNLDGMVTISDFIDLASHFNEVGQMTWQEGDVNYDNSVTISDFIDLAANFNTSYGPVVISADDGMIEDSGHSATVPEPGMLSLLISAFCLKRIRKRVW
jgi:hypothetical protein